MEELLKKLGILYESVQMLFLMEKVSRNVRDHMVAIIGDMEFLLKRATDKDIEKINGFSQSEAFVNKHINLADTTTLVFELKRRGFTSVRDKKGDGENEDSDTEG